MEIIVHNRERMRQIKIKGIKGVVEVSEDGKEILHNKKKLHQSLVKSKSSTHGFYQVSCEGKRIYAHHIVALAYVNNPKPVSYKMVLHQNCVSTDNHYKNLMWGDRAMLFENRKKAGLSGGESALETYRGSSSISYEEAVKIAKRLDKGEYAKDICKEYNVSEMSIARIRKRYCKNKIASPRYSKEIKETVLKLCQVHPPAKVAKIAGVRYETVWKWNKEAQTMGE